MTSSRNPRRAFLGQVAGAAATLGLGTVPVAADAQVQSDDRWLTGLKGKYKQVFDGHAVNDGFPFTYTATFLNTSGADAGAVLILRHGGFVLALNDEIWAKYKLGTAMNVNDPATRAVAVKNPFLKPKPGTLLIDDMAVDKLLARGVKMGACNVALQVLSKNMAANAKVTPEVALKEWTAGIIPGIAVIPSGVWGVNRAQMAGCTYCDAG